MAEALLKSPQFEAKPGSRFEYQSGATQLLGFAIRKAVNVPFLHMLQNFGNLWEWNQTLTGM